MEPAELRRLQQLHFCTDHRLAGTQAAHPRGGEPEGPLAQQGVARPPEQEVATRVSDEGRLDRRATQLSELLALRIYGCCHCVVEKSEHHAHSLISAQELSVDMSQVHILVPAIKCKAKIPATDTCGIHVQLIFQIL